MPWRRRRDATLRAARCCRGVGACAHGCKPADALAHERSRRSRPCVSDVSELNLRDKSVQIDFYNGKEDLMNFKVIISPDDGFYKGGKFTFDVKVAKTYPHDAPKVLCETLCYHPNIDMEGHVCLNILREDWKPVLTIQSVIMGLQFLMLEPNADDPLNKEVRRLAQPSLLLLAQRVRDPVRPLTPRCTPSPPPHLRRLPTCWRRTGLASSARCGVRSREDRWPSVGSHTCSSDRSRHRRPRGCPCLVIVRHASR